MLCLFVPTPVLFSHSWNLSTNLSQFYYVIVTEVRYDCPYAMCSTIVIVNNEIGIGTVNITNQEVGEFVESVIADALIG